MRFRNPLLNQRGRSDRRLFGRGGSQAVSLNLTLVTANVREFSRVPDLKVENWLEQD